eukprot:2410188-Rhodomonas_salina.1
MPFRSVREQYNVPTVSELGLHIQHLRRREAACERDGAVTAVERLDQLRHTIRQDPEIANEAFPFWPTLFNSDQLMEIALEIEGTTDDSTLGY